MDTFLSFVFSFRVDTVFKIVTAKFKAVFYFCYGFWLDTFSRFVFTFGLDTTFKFVAANSKQFSFFVTVFGWTTDRLEEHSVDGTSW